jgi:ketosteroid isomerase-like protein
LHEEGAVTLVPPDGRRVSGHAEIRAALEPIFARRPRATIEVAGKLEADGLALTHARVRVVAGDLEVAGRGTIVSRRQADGSWRIVLDNPLTP